MTWIICFIGTEMRSLHYRQPANGYMCTGSKTASRQSTASLPRLSMAHQQWQSGIDIATRSESLGRNGASSTGLGEYIGMVLPSLSGWI